MQTSDKTDKINRRNNYGEEKPKYQYIYQYILKIWGFRSTFRSTFPISVQEVHISTSGHPEDFDNDLVKIVFSASTQ